VYLVGILYDDSHTLPLMAGQETGDKNREERGGETGEKLVDRSEWLTGKGPELF